MSGYLEGYGVEDAKRERRNKTVLVVGVTVLLLAFSLWLFFRNYFETKRANLFFDSLRQKDYQTAYDLWCPKSKPCPDYPMAKFLEDWGPKSPHADLSSMKIVATRGCSAGVIFQVSFGNGSEEYLWVARQDKTMGYAPWPVCNPRLPAP